MSISSKSQRKRINMQEGMACVADMSITCPMSVQNRSLISQVEALKEALETAQQSLKWVSVKDRIPDEGVPVWGAAPGQFPMMAAIQIDTLGWSWGEVYSYYPQDGQWACEYEVNDDYSWITHWKPLPTPPQEARSDT